MSALHYILQEPKVKLPQSPAIILLHGYGSNEEDLFSFASELPSTHYVISARAPHDMGYGNYAWYAINFDADENKFSDIGQAQQSRDLIATFIDEICLEYSIDNQSITLIGFSQGCILSYAVAVSYPKKVQQVVALSGYFNEEITTPTFKENDLSKLKIFAAHGTADQVIPVDWARKAAPFLKNLGINCTYKEYPIGHGIAPQEFFDFKNWLEQ